MVDHGSVIPFDGGFQRWIFGVCPDLMGKLPGQYSDISFHLIEKIFVVLCLFQQARKLSQGILPAVQYCFFCEGVGGHLHTFDPGPVGAEAQGCGPGVGDQ